MHVLISDYGTLHHIASAIHLKDLAPDPYICPVSNSDNITQVVVIPTDKRPFTYLWRIFDIR